MTFSAQTIDDAMDPNNPYPVQVCFDAEAWTAVIEDCDEEVELMFRNKNEFTVEYANSENFLHALKRFDEYEYQIV